MSSSFPYKSHEQDGDDLNEERARATEDAFSAVRLALEAAETELRAQRAESREWHAAQDALAEARKQTAWLVGRLAQAEEENKRRSVAEADYLETIRARDARVTELEAELEDTQERLADSRSSAGALTAARERIAELEIKLDRAEDDYAAGIKETNDLAAERQSKLVDALQQIADLEEELSGVKMERAELDRKLLSAETKILDEEVALQHREDQHARDMARQRAEERRTAGLVEEVKKDREELASTESWYRSALVIGLIAVVLFVIGFLYMRD